VPIASFTANRTSGSVPLSIQFNDTSSGTPTVWNWSYGDNTWFNTTNNEFRNATKTYSTPGNYIVRLIVSNSAGRNMTIPGINITAIGGEPTITLLYPTSGFNSRDNTITIIGTNFRTNASVSMNKDNTNNTATLSSTSITCRLPTSGLIKGIYNISVTNLDGTSGIIFNAYGLAASSTGPTITSVSPPGGYNSTNNDITITGANFRNCAVIALGKGTNTYSATLTNFTSTNVAATLPTKGLAAGSYNIIVWNCDGTQATKSDAYLLIS
jgi:PKD repeat protein